MTDKQHMRRLERWLPVFKDRRMMIAYPHIENFEFKGYYYAIATTFEEFWWAIRNGECKIKEKKKC